MRSDSANFLFVVIAAYDSIMKIQINKPIIKRQIRAVKFIRSGRS
jgi:hypothetical protein